MRKILPVLMFLLWLPGCSAPPDAALAAENPRAYLAQLEDVHGAKGAQYLGGTQPALIKFWASWCPSCLAELGETENWRKDPAFASVQWATVVSPDFLNEKSAADFRKWYAALDYPDLPVLLDKGGTLAQTQKLQAYPAWLALDENGKVCRMLSGSLNRAQALALSACAAARQTADTAEKTVK